MNRRQGDEAESRRIIGRVGQETEASMAERAGRRVRDHLSARDAPEDDRIEIWGTRIGRVLGLILFGALITWLAVFVFPAS
jgi:hypothetical protein